MSDQPFHYCTGCDGARYPCGTIRALDGAIGGSV